MFEKVKDQYVKPPESLEDLLEKCRITLDGEDTEPKFLYTHKGVGVFPRGDIVVIKGKPKAGKTHFFALIVASLLRSGFKVLWIDTEQAMRNARKIMRKVSIMGSIESLTMFDMRPLTPEQRMAGVTLLTELYKPDIMILDGIKDLTTDVNDQKEAFPVVGELMRLSEEHDICIITAIHENKSDVNATGFLGGEATKKAAEVYQIIKESDGMERYFRILQTDTRNAPAEDMTFRIGEDEIPRFIEVAPPPTRTEIQMSQIISHLNQVVQPGSGLPYSELLDQYTNVSGLSKSTAKRHVNIAVDNQILLKDSNGTYNRRIYVQTDTRS
ncbi:MAG: AAA family ATPase [Candidatus Paceibacterota bacterium]|jgi:hypothetical protein